MDSNEKIKQDIVSILTQAKDRNWKVSKSELVSSLRHSIRGCYYKPESNRKWKMSAGFINSELNDILEELEKENIITIHKTMSKPNAAGYSWPRCFHYTIVDKITTKSWDGYDVPNHCKENDLECGKCLFNIEQRKNMGCTVNPFDED
jgi:hypothetical protein